MTRDSRLNDKRQMIEDLKKALYNDEFNLLYQPKLNIRTYKIVGIESLIRWNHPELGTILPDEFIPLAEQSGLIIPIGEWVIRTACRQNKKWLDMNLFKVVISVNLSAAQFTDTNLVQGIEAIINETGLPAKYLEIEITESMTMEVESTIRTLEGLKRIGVSISMDDFGKGYSSLYFLKRFPLDTLKIDRSFVGESHSNENDAMIVKTVISISHQLNLNVVAEGVETREQLLFLQQNQCDMVQGYLFSKPIRPEELELKFNSIQNKMNIFGIPPEISDQINSDGEDAEASSAWLEVLRTQQGAIFKYVEKDGRFIHTFADGDLIYRWNMLPEQILGKELFEFTPLEFSNNVLPYYKRAWQGEENIFYIINMKKTSYLTTLRPVMGNGEVVEVIASMTDITEISRMKNELRETKGKLNAFENSDGRFMAR